MKSLRPPVGERPSNYGLASLEVQKTQIKDEFDFVGHQHLVLDALEFEALLKKHNAKKKG